MKQTTILFLLLMIAFFASGQHITRQEYINRYQLLAIEEMNRSGIPASITMAQACLESRDGNSELSVKSNNHFGIKCKRGWKGKKVYYDDDSRNECFRKYRTVEDSYVDHTNFLMNNQRYGFLFRLRHTDYKGWARGLKKAGYATAHDYDKRLIKIIEANGLHRLDKKMTFNQLDVIANNNVQSKKSNVTGTLTLTPYNSHQVTRINGVKAVVAQKGDTYEMIAQELRMAYWEVFKYNDQVRGYQPVPNEVVYIHTKKNKAGKKDKSFHRVQLGETLHYISQLYGIKLKSLRKRNHIKKQEHLHPGQIIRLR